MTIIFIGLRRIQFLYASIQFKLKIALNDYHAKFKIKTIESNYSAINFLILITVFLLTP